MSGKATFAGWCYLRDGALVGPIPSNELVLALFRGQVSPDCRVYRVQQNGREIALLVNDQAPVSTLRIEVQSVRPPTDDRSLAPPDVRPNKRLPPPWRLGRKAS